MIGKMFSNMFGNNPAQASGDQPPDVSAVPNTAPSDFPAQPLAQTPAPIDPMPQSPQAPSVPSDMPPVVIQEPTVSAAPSFDPSHKDAVGASLANRMLDAIEKKELTEGEISVISGYILDTIATVNSQAELIAFLKELSWRWPIFKQILKIEQGVNAEKGDDQKAAVIEELIKENKIDDALKAAENAAGGVS